VIALATPRSSRSSTAHHCFATPAITRSRATRETRGDAETRTEGSCGRDPEIRQKQDGGRLVCVRERKPTGPSIWRPLRTNTSTDARRRRDRCIAPSKRACADSQPRRPEIVLNDNVRRGSRDARLAAESRRRACAD